MMAEMMLISALSIAVMFLRKRRISLSNIRINIKGEWVLILLAATEVIAVILFKHFKNPVLMWLVSLIWLIYPAILYITGINFDKNYMKLFFAGTALNFAAILLNGFKMPVFIPELMQGSQATVSALRSGQDLIHSLMTDSTRLKFLCDIITLPPPYPFVKTISAGDILLLIGIFVFWQEESRKDEKI